MKRLLVILVCSAFLITLAAGCTPARKPAPAPNPDPRIVAEPKDSTPRNNGRMPSNSAEMNKLADKLSKEAVQVPGVKSAAVAISGTDAYVGIDLSSQATGSETNRIKSDVANRLKRSDSRLSDVFVSTDADTITRIRRVADGIAQGKPLTSFANELAEIGRRIVPEKS